MAKLVQVGEVLEVQLQRGLGYAQYLGTHELDGDAVAVVPRVFPERPAIEPALLYDSYVTFYPVHLALRQKLVQVVGHLPAAPIPKVFRRQGAMSGREVLTWLIDDGPTTTVKRELSEEELRIPIAGIWNHEYLLNRIAEGWRPEHVGRRPVASEEPIQQPPDPAKASRSAHSVDELCFERHYLYFPDESDAQAAAEELRKARFSARAQRSADGVNWLVLAERQASPDADSLDFAADLMQRVAGSRNGEYDGHERG